jgi:hypothetical protein
MANKAKKWFEDYYARERPWAATPGIDERSKQFYSQLQRETEYDYYESRLTDAQYMQFFGKPKRQLKTVSQVYSDTYQKSLDDYYGQIRDRQLAINQGPREITIFNPEDVGKEGFTPIVKTNFSIGGLNLRATNLTLGGRVQNSGRFIGEDTGKYLSEKASQSGGLANKDAREATSSVQARVKRSLQISPQAGGIGANQTGQGINSLKLFSEAFAGLSSFPVGLSGLSISPIS